MKCIFFVSRLIKRNMQGGSLFECLLLGRVIDIAMVPTLFPWYEGHLIKDALN